MSEGDRPTEPLHFLTAPGQMSALIRDYDWSTTELGPIADWPVAVRCVVAMILYSPLPIVTLWGEAGVMIYNDAYSGFAGARHPRLLGSNVREGWPEVADFNDNVIKTVFRRGETLSYKDQELVLDRGAGSAQAWLNLDYSPIIGDAGGPIGVIAIVVETTDKVVADRQLRDERARLQQMYEQSPSFMALLEGPEHRFSLVNPAYQRLIGNRDVVGKTLAEALPETVAQGYLALLDEVYASKQPFRSNGARYAFQLTPDTQPQLRFLDFVYQPITDAQGKITGIFVDGVDVTDRVLAQEAIRASEAQFRTFAQTMPNHVWTAAPNGLLDWFNERVTEYSGHSGEELAGEGWTEIVHPSDRADAAAKWRTAISSGELYETEFRIHSADGEYRWHLVRALPMRNDAGAITRWIGTNTDIHDRKLSEVENTRDRDRLWSLSQDLMLVCDYDGVVTAVNPSATRLLGWAEDEMVGHPLTAFLHPDDVAGTEAEMDRLASGVLPPTFENRCRRKDGDNRMLEWTAVPDNGRIHAVGRDVTEERRLTRDRDRIWNLSPVLKVVASSSGEISAVNPAWNKVLGWTSLETVGRNILEFIDSGGARPARNGCASSPTGCQC